MSRAPARVPGELVDSRQSEARGQKSVGAKASDQSAYAKASADPPTASLSASASPPKLGKRIDST